MIYINVIGITVLFIFAVFIISKKKKVISDYLLLSIVILFAGYLFSDIWVKHVLNVWSFAFQSVTSYLLGFPFILYGLVLIDKTHRVKPKWLWFGIFDLVYCTFLFLDIWVIHDYTGEDLAGMYLSPPLIYHIFYKGHMLYTIGTMLWFLARLNRYQLKIKNYYSNLERVHLDWVRHFVWMYIAVYTTALTIFLAFNFELVKNIEIPFLVVNLVLVLSLMYLVFYGIRQYSLANFSENNNPSPPQKVQTSQEKYQSSSLSDSEMTGLYAQIEELFDQDIYHDAELKVQHIAQKLGVTSHNISQTLNQKAGKTFYEFVNSYRVDYFKELLSDPDKSRYTILALGMESGFNSKASLNRVFKQQIGITPREYQQKAIA